jgi:hypothetical protein
MYVVIGPDGTETAPVALGTLQEWVGRGQLPKHAVIVKPDGTRIVAGSMDELLGFYAMVPAPYASAPTSDGTLGGLMPYHNPKALLAYYFGYVAMLPMIGIVMIPFVFMWAVKALRAYKENPAVRGKGHAITGIVFACIGTLISVPLWVLLIVALSTTKR